MARSMRFAVGLGLTLAVLAGCATTGERRMAQGAQGGWTSCDPSPRTFYLVCVKR